MYIIIHVDCRSRRPTPIFSHRIFTLLSISYVNLGREAQFPEQLLVAPSNYSATSWKLSWNEAKLPFFSVSRRWVGSTPRDQ